MPERREKGTGTYKKVDGGWQLRFEAGRSPDGKRLRIKRTRRTKQDCRDARDEYFRDLEAPAAADLSVEDFLESWLAEYKPSVSTKTHTQAASLLRNHVVPALGALRLQSLTTLRCQQRWVEMSSTHARATIERTRSRLSMAMNAARRDELVTRNVVTDTKVPKMTQAQRTTLSVDETQRLLQEATGHANEALVVLLTRYGLRSGEARGLRRCDLDFTRDAISINGSLNDDRGESDQRGTPKTDRSRRVIPMTPGVKAALLDHLATADIDCNPKEPQPPVGSLEGLLFTNSRGTPLTAKQLSMFIDRLTTASGVPRVTPHELRHTAATQMLQKSIDIAKVSAILGHKSISITVDRYGHLVPADAHEGLLELDEMLTVRDV